MKVDRKEFQAILETVNPAVSAAGAIVVLRHIWFDVKFVYAYDGGLGIRRTWKSELKGGALAAPLLGIVKGASADTVSIEQSDTQWEIKVGRAKVTIPVLLADQNPWNFTSLGKAETIELTPELVAGLKRVRQVKATRPMRAEHYGVTVFPFDGEVGLYTTDSNMMAQVFVKGELPAKLAKTILPHGFVSELLKLGVGTSLSFYADSIVAVNGDVQVCTNMLDRTAVLELPGFVEKALEKVSAATPIAEGLDEALSRAETLAGPDDAYVKVALSKSELALDGRLKYGELQERLPVKGAAVGNICVSLDQLKSLVKTTVEMAITDNALVLFGEDEATFLIAAYEEVRK